MRSHWKSYLCAGLVIFAGHQGVYSQIDPFLPPHDPVWKIWGLPLVFLKVGAAVLLSFSLIGFVEDKLGKFNSMTRYMSDASYWMYLVHLPIVTFISFFMFNIKLPIELKFLLSVAITVVACLVTYKYLVRNTLLGLMLNGRRY
jgi:peptidoglycan/LPS O-acetylase OafA/YrhL